MPTRLIRALQAGGALLLVAGSLDALSRPSKPPSHHVVLAPLLPSTTPAPTTTPATAATPTTSSPAATTTSKAAPATVTAPTQPALDAAHRWAVGVTTLTFVDTSRPTPPAGNAPGAGSRTLTTIVRYPADGLAAAPETQAATPSHAGGPFPLIVFAHGYDSSPAVYAALLHAWASAGYVVAAPEFPR
ncbi:MAG TPA: hypothetical protein VKQ71_11785, partial [Acidimicrobiales bacterium]|nr:hypothetical protein [Acidimicrobiales bacterium]